MKNRRLIILPGIGNPKHDSYADVYKIISNEAERLEYKSIDIFEYPGHTTFDINDTTSLLRLDHAASQVKQKIQNLDTNFKYDFICRSYGCSVFMKLLADLDTLPSFVNKAVLWGPAPFSVFYKLFIEQEEERKILSLNKGTRANRELFETMYPFELAISHFTNNIKLKIAYGSLDEYCTPSFASLLKESYPKNKIIFQKIDGLKHEVREPHREYLDALFNDFLYS